MVFTAQNLADITTNNAKISADGSVNTHYDINITGPSPGEILMFDGASWVNTPHVVADGSVNTHNDVDYGSPQVGDILTWNGTQWTNIASSSTGISPQQAADITSNNAKVSADGSVNTHNDVQVTSPSNGDILAYDGINWINIPATVGITPQQASDIINNNQKTSADGSVNTHNDVNYTSPNPGDILTWDGTNWVNVPEGVKITLPSTPQLHDLIYFDGTSWMNFSVEEVFSIGQDIVGITPHALMSNAHTDINIISPTVGQVLTWSGTQWTNAPPTGPTNTVTWLKRGWIQLFNPNVEQSYTVTFSSIGTSTYIVVGSISSTSGTPINDNQFTWCISNKTMTSFIVNINDTSELPIPTTQGINFEYYILQL